MKIYYKQIGALVLGGALSMTSNIAFARENSNNHNDNHCAPGVENLIKSNANYKELYSKINPEVDTFKTELMNATTSAKYDILLAHARKVSGKTHRILITLPDGTTVLDTAKTDAAGATCSGDSANSFSCYQAKRVNENHNSRIAILATQLYSCGLGAETKASTSLGHRQAYVGVRMGEYLNNAGTVMISKAISE